MIFGVKQDLFFLFLTGVVILTGCNSGPKFDAEIHTIVDTNAPPIDLSVKITHAKTENKLLLLEFGSSDSCPPCIVLQNEVFSKPEFQAYEKSNLVFVRLDFPQRTQLPSDVQATNMFLSRQFDQFIFPTFIALDHAGKEFWRYPAKDDPNPGIDTALFEPKGFIALLESVKAKQK
jgi:thioredoxin-related protein